MIAHFYGGPLDGQLKYAEEWPRHYLWQKDEYHRQKHGYYQVYPSYYNDWQSLDTAWYDYAGKV